MNQFLDRYFHKKAEADSLALFRVLFGLMMFGSLLRFYANGWIEHLYLEPKFFFSYYGFEWVKPIGNATYVIFAVCGIASLMVALGFYYRLGIISFFLSFTYIELMDKTTYLNHYYFISALSFIMIFLPANAYFSLDAWRQPNRKKNKISAWCIDAIKVMLGIVYFYAGLAKLNSDWLLEAMPLSIWLSTKTDLPIIGQFVMEKWFHFAMSWLGAIYDLTIPFLLLFKPTRFWAYLAVIFFHVITGWLFPIGMFPYIMIVSTLIFFPASMHQKAINFIQKAFKNRKKADYQHTALSPTKTTSNLKSRWAFSILSIFFLIQIFMPFRYLAYPDELFWTEEGFRFSWRVMLMEKAGYAQFKVVNSETGRSFYVDNTEFLTPFQEKQMSFQPDFILEYAHFLATHYEKEGIPNPKIYVESYVALNGRSSQPYIDPTVDLSKIEDSFSHKYWILPFNDKIVGL